MVEKRRRYVVKKEWRMERNEEVTVVFVYLKL